MTVRRWLLTLSVLVIAAAMGAMWAHSLLAASALQQLTTDPGADVRPSWSPDGQRVAFQSNRSGSYSIWVMDADGQNQRVVSPGITDDRHPAWSPDGKQLAFDSDVSGSEEIWIVDSDGRNPQQITSLGARSNFPAWSPDGTQIAFYVYKNGIMDLWVVQVDGSSLRPLTSDLANERRNECTFACHQAAWSPDGQQIAFEGGDHRSIWVANPDGSNLAELVHSDHGRQHNHFPWYAPDGRLGYITEHVTPAEAWTDAWLVDPVSGKVTLVVDRIRHQGPLEWSPDGAKILFHSPRGGNFDIYVLDLLAEGGRDELQTRPEDRVTSSPDSGFVAPSQETSPDSPASAAPEATSSARFASPLVLGVIAGLIGLVGLIVVVSIVRRSRRV